MAKHVDTVIPFLFILGFMVAFFVDNLAFAFRSEGLKAGSFAVGTLRATQVMLINRLGAAAMFTSAGWMLDRGVHFDTLTALSVTAVISLAMSNLCYLGYYRGFSRGLKRFLGISFTPGDSEPVTLTHRRLLSRPFLAFPFAFNLLGTFVPILVAARFPDYRATILQLGFIFNSLASVLNAFIIEPGFILRVQSGDGASAEIYQLAVCESKTVFLFIGAIFLLVPLLI